MKPVFITFEGGEGAGKSTQIERLSQHMQGLGHDVVVTREPGGSPDANVLRELLVHGEPGRWSAHAEALLNYAARESHLNHLIRPALAQAAACFATGLPTRPAPTRVLRAVLARSSWKCWTRRSSATSQPDLTLVFDLDPQVGLERARQRGGADQLRKKGTGVSPAPARRLHADCTRSPGQVPDHRCIRQRGRRRRPDP
jgi:dTMP kinase